MQTQTTSNLPQGIISSVHEDGYMIDTDDGTLRAQVAFSCLVAPQAGDTILYAPGETCYILAILKRTSPDAELCVDGEFTIRSSQGRVKLLAQEGITTATAGDLTIAATRTCLRTDEANAHARIFRVEGEESSVQLERSNCVIGAVHAVIERMTQHLRSLFRRTEEREEVQAGEIAMQSDSLLSMQSEYTVMVSEEVTKIDAEQIHMG